MYLKATDCIKTSIYIYIYCIDLFCFKQDILDYTDTLCSGKQTCTFHSGKLIEEEIHPCPVTVMSYLEAQYKCVSGK